MGFSNRIVVCELDGLIDVGFLLLGISLSLKV